jgi:hypothetical protein
VLHEIPLSVIFGVQRPRRLIFVTKENLLSRIYHETHGFPRHWVIVQRHGMPGQTHADELVSLSRRLDLPINFVGDLSPFHLHVFLELDDLIKGQVGRLRWAGIGARWIDLCKRLARSQPLAHLERKMSPLEREHLAALQSHAPWLETALGAEPWKLLSSGKTISLEAASGVSGYADGFHRKLLRLLDLETRPAP